MESISSGHLYQFQQNLTEILRLSYLVRDSYEMSKLSIIWSVISRLCPSAVHNVPSPETLGGGLSCSASNGQGSTASRSFYSVPLLFLQVLG